MARVLSGTPELASKKTQLTTQLVIQNSSPFPLGLYNSKGLYGSGYASTDIPAYSTTQFSLPSSNNDVEIVLYEFKLETASSKEGQLYWWVIARRNRPDKWNQVYTSFRSASTSSGIDPEEIKGHFKEDEPSNVYRFEDGDLSATLVIDRSSSSPTLTAVLVKPAAKSNAN